MSGAKAMVVASGGGHRWPAAPGWTRAGDDTGRDLHRLTAGPVVAAPGSGRPWPAAQGWTSAGHAGYDTDKEPGR